MFSLKLKSEIADKIQKILRETDHPELPKNKEINFLLHVDGAECWSWVNIVNNGSQVRKIPNELISNTTVPYKL